MSAMTLADVGEFGLIDRIRELLPEGPAVTVGAGDDAAILDLNWPVIASVDTMVEGRHFRREWVGAADIGARAAAASIADIAAMGGHCGALLVSLGLPAATDVDWVLELVGGIVAEAALVGASVAGGDIARSDAVVVTVTALGSANGGTIVRRSGAQPGDVVALAGRQGWAAAGLTVLSRGFRSPRALVQAYQRPVPPYASGPAAAAGGATAMIDVSDGLLADLRHLAQASGVVADVQSATVPVADQLRDTASAFNVDPLTWVLAGGEDHSLLATFPPDVPLPDLFTVIGRIEPVGGEGAGVAVDGRFWAGQGGHDHFR